MSTKLTTEMVSSLSLDLYHAARAYQERLGARLQSALARDHGIDIGPAQLGFLAALICGENTASGIARALGISRQAVARQVSEMEGRGFLRTRTDPARRNQQLITFTDEGVALMATCRRILADMDQEFGAETAPLRVAVDALNGNGTG